MAHIKAFNAVVHEVRDVVICNNEVIRLQLILDIYIGELHDNGFPDDRCRSFQLSSKLEKLKVFEQINFTTMAERGYISTKLMYNSSISAGEAIGYAYKLGCKEKLGLFSSASSRYL